MLDESKIFYTLIYKGFPKNNDIYDIEENMIFVPDGFGSISFTKNKHYS